MEGTARDSSGAAEPVLAASDRAFGDIDLLLRASWNGLILTVGRAFWVECAARADNAVARVRTEVMN